MHPADWRCCWRLRCISCMKAQPLLASHPAAVLPPCAGAAHSGRPAAAARLGAARPAGRGGLRCRGKCSRGCLCKMQCRRQCVNLHVHRRCSRWSGSGRDGMAWHPSGLSIVCFQSTNDLPQPHPLHLRIRCAPTWRPAGCRSSRSCTLAPQPAIWKLSAAPIGSWQCSNGPTSCARCWKRCCRCGAASWMPLSWRQVGRRRQSAARRRRVVPFSQQQCVPRSPSRPPSRMRHCSRRLGACCSSCSARCRDSASESERHARRRRSRRLVAAPAVAAAVGRRQRRARGGTACLADALRTRAAYHAHYASCMQELQLGARVSRHVHACGHGTTAPAHACTVAAAVR